MQYPPLPQAVIGPLLASSRLLKFVPQEHCFLSLEGIGPWFKASGCGFAGGLGGWVLKRGLQ